MNKNCAVILAAGEGTRMKSSKPKVLAQVMFVPMIDWVISAVRASGVEDICAVTGHLSETVCEHLGGACETVLQAQRLEKFSNLFSWCHFVFSFLIYIFLKSP